ncbi:MAG TPA: hypothetical protein VGF55_01615 [Gemmataceae bacterium]|jgi:hypothetical protein
MKPLAPLIAAVMLVGPARAADPPPERLIPASAQVYVRWDGVAAHREQYAQTALGQLLGRDLAPLRQELLDYFPRTLRAELTERKLLDGLPPQRLVKIHAAVTESSRLLDVLADHGLIVAADVSPLPSLWQMAVGGVQSALGKKLEGNPLLPHFQVTLIVPDAAADASPILSVLRLLDSDKSIEVKEESVAGRKLLHAVIEGVHTTAWVEGPHVVVTVGTDPPPLVLARIDGAGPRLDANPLFKRLQSDSGFRTDVRAFVDVKSFVGIAQRLLAMTDASLGKKLDALGMDGVHAIVFRGGFDGPQMRQVIEVDAPGPRKGILRLVGGRPVTLDALPPMPPDVSRWSAHRLDPAAVYDVGLQLFDLTHPPDSDAGVEADTAAQRLDKAAGIDVKADLLPCLGDTVVAYASPSEGLISFGQVFAVEVKDGERVLQALDQIVQTQAGGNVRLRKRPIADGEVREIYVRKQGFFFTPTYAVYKGWLVMSLYPQPVQAFVQRAGGGAKAWEPDAGVKAGFAALPKTATGLAVADPRPSVQQALTFAPIIIGAAQGFGGGGTFEVGTLPSASVVNQRLTPTVTALADDGAVLRWESRGAIPLPGDFLGLDPVLLLISASIFN